MINRRILKAIAIPLRLRGAASMAWGRASSLTPLSRDWGYSRGTPIDRLYIEDFLQKHASDIHGRVLEIGDASYSARFGGGRISRQDILHIEAGTPGATIVGDLSTPGVLPERAFDCIILTQTLHLIFDVDGATRQLHNAIRPGGVLLMTVPGITPIDRGEWGSSWYWSMTDQAVAKLLGQYFDPANVEVSSFGNLFAATAFLHGAAVEEVPRRKLRQFDPFYPVTVAARAIA